MQLQPDPCARWVSSLHCGHQARTRGRPRRGQWITCPDGRCQGQRRVDAVAAVAAARPRLLDLFCGPGGAGMGYHRAGFDVTGVDIHPQPRYPFEFIRADAMTFPLGGYDAIAASPICQGHANVTDWRGNRGDYPDLLTPTIARLSAQPLPWVVENVPEAPLRADFLLCGSQFGLKVQRHRSFQTSWRAFHLASPCDHRGLIPFMHKNERAFADAMGCTWMNKTEARQAIPPAYAEYVGRHLIEQLAGKRAA